VQANSKEPSPSESRAPLPRWLRSRPKGALLFAFRLPIYLYRLKLGWSLGHRFLLLIHRGRKSGLLHQTVLEVVRYNPATEESVVLSARGEKADWYRNIEENPTLEVWTAGERYAPKQRFLAPKENEAVISEYARRHPVAFRFLVKVLGFNSPLEGSEEARQEAARSLRLVAFRPQG
jgi:deazaflavin-dependent oxidoreductase (nitroreductase family)